MITSSTGTRALACWHQSLSWRRLSPRWRCPPVTCWFCDLRDADGL